MPEEIYSKVESKGAVQIFLSELRTIFKGKYRFDLPNREDKPMEFSNEYCLSVLDYDVQDVIEELKSLTLKEYSRTLIAHEAKNKNVYSYEFR